VTSLSGTAAAEVQWMVVNCTNSVANTGLSPSVLGASDAEMLDAVANRSGAADCAPSTCDAAFERWVAFNLCGDLNRGGAAV
jgi:hypothetical protein